MNEGKLFLVKHSEGEDVRVCCRCGSARLLILFPKTPKTGVYSKVCQACTTEQDRRDEASKLAICFWRNQRVVPIGKKRRRGTCGP